ncbi:MAG: carboxypeptidase regulatory-like domain-containing protein, partial [Endomicrobiales bacterium]
MRKSAALFLLPFILTGTISAATLTVRVKDTGNTPLPGMMVAVIAFRQGDNSGAPDSLKSGMLMSNENGTATFAIETGCDYQVFTSSQGYSPTIREQMNNPFYAPLRTTGNDIVADRYLSRDPALAGNGQIVLTITGMSEGDLIFGDVRNVTNDEPVAFSIAKSVSAGSSTAAQLRFFNVPAGAAGSYNVSAGIPDKQMGYMFTEIPKLEAGQTIPLSVNSSSFTMAGRVDRQDEPAGNVSFEGVVIDKVSLAGLKDCVVTLREKTEDFNFQKNFVEFAETRTDFGGHFAFYDVPVSSYAVEVTKEGYEGFWYEGMSGLRPDRPGDRWIRGYDGKDNIALEIASGTIHGHVYMWKDGQAWGIPGAEVNLWPDWSTWQTVPGDPYDNYYTTGSEHRAGRTNAHVRTGTDGSYRVTGMGYGNYQIAVWSSLISNQFTYNNGSDGRASTTWPRGEDDLRVTVLPDDWTSVVYNVSGATVVTNVSGIDVFIGTYTVPSGRITGTIFFDVPGDTVQISSAEPVTVWAWQDGYSDGPMKNYFTLISGDALSKEYPFEIQASTGYQYQVQLESRRWGEVGRRETPRADLSVNAVASGFDYKMIPGGTIRGVVRLPDGRLFKGRWTQNSSESIEVMASGMNSGNGGQVREDGQFEIMRLAPGTYRLTTRNERRIRDGNSETVVPLGWPDAELDGVQVRAGMDTYIEIQLKEGAMVVPKTPSMPPIPAVPGFSRPNTRYGIMKFPSSVGATRETLGSLMGEKDSFSRNVAFSYDSTRSSEPWGQRRILPGRYDFYLSRIDTFSGGHAEEGEQPGDHFSVTFISQLKNVEINFDPLKPGTTTFLEFESGTLGMSSLKGQVKGNSIFTQEDVDIITKSGMDKFLSYIPSVMLYDAQGQMKAFSMGLPAPERIMEWDKHIEENSFTLDWFRQELAQYPVSYRAERLPAGEYVAVFETPNYPPMMKKVTLASGDNTLDVNFDDNLILGSGIAGVVKSTDSAPLPDVMITLSHRTVNKTLKTDPLGRFSVSGLPPGTYRLSLSKPGFVPGAEKFGLGQDVKRFEGDDALVLSRADATIQGTVYSQKMPTPKVIVGAKVVAYNETYNTANPGKMLPVISVKTDDQGRYFLDGILSGSVYKIHVLAPGKLLEWQTLGSAQNPLSAGDNAGVDFVLKSLPPRLKINMGKIYENGRFLYKFFIESPKKIINPSNPSSLAAPYCRYSPVAGATSDFDVSAAVEVLPNIGPEVANPDGGKIYNYSLKIPVVEDREYYKLRVEATDGSTDYHEDILFGPKIEARAKRDMKEEIAEGGNVSLDDTGSDATQVTVDAGSLTPTGAETSSIQQNGENIPIGGFLSAMPNFNLSKTGSAKSAAMARIVESAAASDVYEVALGDAQLNRSLSLNLKFDVSRVTDADLPNLSICQYDSRLDKWVRVPGAVTVDPVTGVVSVDVDSLENATGSSRSTAPGKAAIKNGMFVVNRAASTS